MTMAAINKHISFYQELGSRKKEHICGHEWFLGQYNYFLCYIVLCGWYPTFVKTHKTVKHKK